jgi:hypothetical protein
MRWDSLFEDLEGQLEQELDAEELELRAEEERLRIGRMTLRDRIVAVAGPDSSELLRLALADGSAVELRMTAYGRDWVAGEAVGDLNRRGPVVVPIGAVAAVALGAGQVEQSLASVSASAAPPLADRLGLAFVLRSVCRRRSPVELVIPAGILHGTLDRVGRDHLDLAMHDPGSERRRNAVRQVRIVPFAQLLLVRI